MILNMYTADLYCPSYHFWRSDFESYISSRQLSGRHAKRSGLEMYIANQ